MEKTNAFGASRAGGRRTEGVHVEQRSSANRGWLFDQFLRELLAALPNVTDLDTEGHSSSLTGVRVDFAVKFDGAPMLVEAKVLTPQTAYRLKDAVEQIQVAGNVYQQANGLDDRPRLVIAFPGALAPQRESAAHAAGVEFWDGSILRRMARSTGLPAPDFLATSDVAESAPRNEPSEVLLHRLAEIPPGQAGWAAFERFVENLLNSMFVPPLSLDVRAPTQYGDPAEQH